MSAPTVLLAGDSTVSACLAPETPMSGWGVHLGAPLNRALALASHGAAPVVPVLDVARGGATTESHREEGLWAALIREAQPGDVVVLQFGHNDQKREHLAARTGYTANLRRFVEEIRALDAVPVLCTPVARRLFEADGAGPRLVQSHGEHPQAVRDLADELGVQLIDLTAATTELYEALGPEASRAHLTHLAPGVSSLYPDGIADDTHYSFRGAVAVAQIVADALAPTVLAQTSPEAATA